MSIFSRFLPKRKPTVMKSNTPKEKETVRKMFGLYCQKKHNTAAGKKLCPKCTALLATVMLKMSRCPYGITKPICEKCPNACFGTVQTKEFIEIMNGVQGRMFFRHPIMSLRHKLLGMRREATKEDIKKERSTKEKKEKK